MNGNTAHPGTNKNTFTNVDLKLIYQCDACILICNIVVFNYFKIKYVFFQRLNVFVNMVFQSVFSVIDSLICWPLFEKCMRIIPYDILLEMYFQNKKNMYKRRQMLFQSKINVFFKHFTWIYFLYSR